LGCPKPRQDLGSFLDNSSQRSSPVGTEMETSRYRKDGRWVFVVSVFLAIIAFIVTVNLVFWPPGYLSWYEFSFGWIWAVPFVFFFLFFGLRWFFRPWGWGDRRGYWNGEDAYFVLRERFARGEITREQFEQMSRDLQEHERT
jgi:putative membrane protein